MELRELRYFAAVYEEGSVTAASRRCYISQPSVSAALAALETELGAKLFLRHKKGVSPTAAAERLYPEARKLVDGAQAVRSLFRNEIAKPIIRVGLMRTLDIERAMQMIAPIVSMAGPRLALVDADVPAELRVVSRRMLRDGETFLPLWSERYVLAIPSNHPLTLNTSIHAADLSGVGMVSRCSCEYGDLLDKGEPPRNVATAHSEEWAVALVRSGIGVAILPEGVVSQSAGLVLRDIEDVHIVREVGLAHGGGMAPDAEIMRMVEAVAGRRH